MFVFCKDKAKTIHLIPVLSKQFSIPGSMLSVFMKENLKFEVKIQSPLTPPAAEDQNPRLRGKKRERLSNEMKEETEFTGQRM